MTDKNSTPAVEVEISPQAVSNITWTLRLVFALLMFISLLSIPYLSAATMFITAAGMWLFTFIFYGYWIAYFKGSVPYPLGKETKTDETIAHLIMWPAGLIIMIAMGWTITAWVTGTWVIGSCFVALYNFLHTKQKAQENNDEAVEDDSQGDAE